MIIIHKNPKRTRSEMKLEPLQRVASVTKSPPKKRVKEVESNNNSDTKDIIVSNLETRNAHLVETADRKQELIDKQAKVIGDLKADLEQATLALVVKEATITELKENLLKAAAEANRTTGTSLTQETVPPGGEQDQAGRPANLAASLQEEDKEKQDLQPHWKAMKILNRKKFRNFSYLMKADGKIWAHIRRRGDNYTVL